MSIKYAFLIGPPLLMWLARRYAPAEPTPPVSAEERERFEGWKIPWGLAYMLFSALCSIPIFGCLHFLFVVLARPRIGSLLMLEPVPHLWWLIAIFFGVLAAAWPTRWCLRRCVGAESDRFEQFIDQRQNYDSRRLTQIFVAILVPGAVLGLVAGVTKADQLTTQGIVVGEAFVSHPPLRPYRSVRTIEHGTYTRVSERRPRDHDWFIVTFDDGTRWSYRDVWWDADDRTLVRTVLELVSARSGRPITER